MMKLVEVGYRMLQSRYASAREEVCLSATFVTARISAPVNVRKFFRRVRATKYVHLRISYHFTSDA